MLIIERVWGLGLLGGAEREWRLVFRGLGRRFG
jgi:hypothetical protein